MARRTPDPEPGPDAPRPRLVVWIGPRFTTPPMTEAARVEAGRLLRRVQDGESLGMPLSRPMPSIGPRCHELRIRDESRNWRAIYRIDADAIVVASLFAKSTRATPGPEIDLARRRLADYDS